MNQEIVTQNSQDQHFVLITTRNLRSPKVNQIRSPPPETNEEQTDFQILDEPASFYSIPTSQKHNLLDSSFLQYNEMILFS